MKWVARDVSLVVLAALGFGLCSASARSEPGPAAAPAVSLPAPPAPVIDMSRAALLPGMPAPVDPGDVYAADRPGRLSATVRRDRSLIYVPNFGSGTVSTIDPASHRVIQTHRVGAGPQHVVPSWDLRTLWVNSNVGNSLTPIDARTGRFGQPVRVDDPYNLYFTPDGRSAMVMAESRQQIVFRDPHTMAVEHVLPVHCAGVNHADFSADGRFFIVTCEFSGDLLKVDTAAQRVIGRLHLPGHAMPQDIKISPDGRTWYVADMQTGGVWLLDGDTFTPPTFLPTGDGAHGLYPSRDSRHLYVANRAEGTISVISFATRTIVRKWTLPGHASPDMGGAPRTAGSCGSPAVTTGRSTPSTPRPAG